VIRRSHDSDNKRPLLLPFLRSLLCGVLIVGSVAAGLAADAKAGDPPGKVGFRQPRVALNSNPVAEPAPAPVPSLKSPPLFTDAEDLAEKRQTLQGEVRYAKAKLEAAQKQLALQTAAGDLEKAGRIDEEVKDWQARYSSSKAQLDLIDKELSESSRGSGQVAVGDEIVVPGENLEVFVNEDPSFNGIYQVRRGGYIIMPQVGRIAVAGKSLSAAEAAVKRALQSSQLQNASVMIERKQGADIENGPLVYLAGEFKTPRPWRIPTGVTPTLVNVI